MTSRDKDFKALQLEMMDRYPHYICPEELHKLRSGDSATRICMPQSSEPNMAGPPGEQYGEVMQFTPRQSSKDSYSEIIKDLDERERKKEERKGRHSREILRDCLLILIEVVLIFVIILALAKYGYFGGGEESKGSHQPELDIKSPEPILRRDDKVILVERSDRASRAPTPPRTINTIKWPPFTGTELEERVPNTDTNTAAAPVSTQNVAHSPEPSPKGGPLRLIMDVDPGVDDALALIFALTSERATVDAITVVAGNTELDTAYDNTRRVLQVLEMPDVPIYKGAKRPISRQLHVEETFFGPDQFGGVSGKYPVAQVRESNKLAHIALRDMVKQRPREYTLVFLGPLTNMATAILTDPSLTDDVARIFILGGNAFGKSNVLQGGEFNFVTDPEAARVVLQRATCPVTVVTWESVLQAAVPWGVYNDVTAEDMKLARFIRDINNHTIHCCLKHAPGYTLGDFLGVLAALVPESVKGFIESRVDVELYGEYSRGQMVHAWVPNLLPHIRHNVTVVQSFNNDVVIEHFRKMLGTDDDK